MLLGNVCKYHHNSYTAKTRLSGQHFCRIQYRSTFNDFDIIGPKTTKFSEIMQNNGYYAIQGHSRSPMLLPIKNHMRLPITVAIKTNLCPILHRFQIITDYQLNMRFRQGYLSLTHSFRVNPSTQDNEIQPQKIVTFSTV